MEERRLFDSAGYVASDETNQEQKSDEEDLIDLEIAELIASMPSLPFSFNSPPPHL